MSRICRYVARLGTACFVAIFTLLTGPSTLQATSYTLSTLVTFTGTNGYTPGGGVTFDSSGNLYGTTEFGGAAGEGTVFKVDAVTHAITTLVSFNGSNGAYPLAGLSLDAIGNLFGTTSAGGASGIGTVFELVATPEPSTLMLAAIGLISLPLVYRRHRR
jgi:uncharacterized repeat protein (TIGR03803 family)